MWWSQLLHQQHSYNNHHEANEYITSLGLEQVILGKSLRPASQCFDYILQHRDYPGETLGFQKKTISQFNKVSTIELLVSPSCLHITHFKQLIFIIEQVGNRPSTSCSPSSVTPSPTPPIYQRLGYPRMHISASLSRKPIPIRHNNNLYANEVNQIPLPYLQSSFFSLCKVQGSESHPNIPCQVTAQPKI